MTKAELQERVEQLSQDVVDLSEGFTNVVKLLRQAEKRIRALEQLEQEQEFLLNCDSGNKIYGKVDVEHYLQSEE